MWNRVRRWLDDTGLRLQGLGTLGARQAFAEDATPYCAAEGEDEPSAEQDAGHRVAVATKPLSGTKRVR